MAISPKCDRCKQELIDFGAILLGPPDENDKVKKFHICKPCYQQVAKELQ